MKIKSPQKTLDQAAHCALLTLSLGVPALCTTTLSFAQNAPQNTVAPNQLEDIVVTATRDARDAFDVPASINKLSQDTLQKTGGFAVNLSESLTRIPGLVINNRNNFAQDLQLSIRGFGARSTSGVRGVRLISDGIPATMPDGSGQISHFGLSSAESIEVLRGPFSSLYGNSSGGVIQITTEEAKPGEYVEASQAFGSYGASRTGLKLTHGGEQVGIVMDVSRFETDGYRNHSNAQRDNINGKMVWNASDDTKVSWVVNYVDMPEVQDPLGLTQSQLGDPRQAGTGAETRNTRKSVLQSQTGFTIEHRLNASTALIVSPYVGERAINQVLTTGVIDLKNKFSGADARVRHRTTLLDSPLIVNAGINSGNLDQNRKGFNNINGNASGAATRDETNNARNFDQYLQGEWLINDRFSTVGGIRHSTVQIRSQDNILSNGDGSGSKDYKAWTSNLGLTFHVNDHINTYASFGQGFETPTLLETAYRDPGNPNFNPDLTAAKSKQYEVGIKGKWSSTRVNAAVYTVNTNNEIVVKSSSGGTTAFQNAGQTSRKGVELALQQQVCEQVSSYVSVNYIDASYDTSTNTIVGGNYLPSIPKRTVFGELSYKPTPAIEAATEIRYVDKLYASDRNADFAPGYSLVNLRASWSVPVNNITVRTYARIDNLFDKRYVGSVIVNQAAGQFFEPAPGRQWLAGVSVGIRWK